MLLLLILKTVNLVVAIPAITIKKYIVNKHTVMSKKEKQDTIISSTSMDYICPMCNKNQTITDPESGEIICKNCGTIISEKAQQEEVVRPECRGFSPEQANAKKRTGGQTSFARHDMGLATVIGKTDRDASGQKINASMHSMMERLRKWDFRTQIHTPTDRNLSQAFVELDILKDKLALPSAVIEKTAYIYRKVQQRGFVRGRTISAVLVAIVYLVCRELGIPRTLKDIGAADNNLRRKSISRMYRLLLLELDLKVPLVDPMKCIAKVANKTNLGESTRRKALSIMNDITRENELLSIGKDPMGFAATVLYISSLKNGESITQQNIANAAGISSVTLRNRLKMMKSELQLN